MTPWGKHDDEVIVEVAVKYFGAACSKDKFYKERFFISACNLHYGRGRHPWLRYRDRREFAFDGANNFSFIP